MSKLNSLITIAVLLAAQGCSQPQCECTCDCSKQIEDALAAKSAREAAQKPKPAPQIQQQALKAGEFGSAERVFTAALDPSSNTDFVLTANGDFLSAASAEGGEPKWRIQGPGSVHNAVLADLGNGPTLFVVWGMGREHMDAPLLVEERDPATGNLLKERFRFSGERNESASVSVADIDKDGKSEIILGYFRSKYMVGTRILDNQEGDRDIDGEIRMATSRAFVDVNHDGIPEEVIGRVYGDGLKEPGDLKVRLNGELVKIPTENGVRAVTNWGNDAILFADGWMANYGKDARGNLAIARFNNGSFDIERLPVSEKDFSHFELYTADLDKDGKDEIVTRGSSQLSIYRQTADGWKQEVVSPVSASVFNSAMGRTAQGYTLYLPGRQGTRPVTLK